MADTKSGNMMRDANRQAALIKVIARTLRQDGKPLQVFETHLSWVLVTQDVAYKFKRALRFDFVDFTTLESREHYCREEIRLNRRFAPNIYLGVSTVGGDIERPLLDGGGEPIEFAVKMRAFPQDALWSSRLSAGSLSMAEVEAWADAIADIHGKAGIAPPESAWGRAERLHATAMDILSGIAGLVKHDRPERDEVAEWHERQWSALSAVFEDRKALGRVRECHGDLHAKNILTLNGVAEAFDCIEFSEELRWIDVMNDIAFLCMDMEYRGRSDMAMRFLNRYLFASGDYHGLLVLRYYKTLRALVRAKVAWLHSAQMDSANPDRDQAVGEARAYLDYAAGEIRRSRSSIAIMHGLSGSGKSAVAQRISDLSGAIWIRSDVERKRMGGMPASVRAPSSVNEGMYGEASTRATYDRLRMLAKRAAECGMPVIVDAAFLRQWQRTSFEALARELDIPFLIVDVRAGESAMRERIVSRALSGRDPSDAGIPVWEHQLSASDPLSPDERRLAATVDNHAAFPEEAIGRLAASMRVAAHRHHHG